jgi:hypothetical protein
MANTRNRGDN